LPALEAHLGEAYLATHLLQTYHQHAASASQPKLLYL